jgi:hypothetical protein
VVGKYFLNAPILEDLPEGTKMLWSGKYVSNMDDGMSHIHRLYIQQFPKDDDYLLTGNYKNVWRVSACNNAENNLGEYWFTIVETGCTTGDGVDRGRTTADVVTFTAAPSEGVKVRK